MTVKSGVKLICDGYVYGRHSENKFKTNWRCTSRGSASGSCKARAVTMAANPGVVKLTCSVHNHAPNLAMFLEKNCPKKADFLIRNVVGNIFIDEN